MRTMTRAEIKALSGEKAVPEVRTASAGEQIKESLSGVAERMGQSALIMAASAEVIAQAVGKPAQKVLEAVIHRDENGRMSGVTITVKPKE